MKLLQEPIDFYNDRNRFRALIVLHSIDAVCFVIRFVLICVDLSNAQQEPSNIGYPVCIFFLEIFGSLPILVPNIIYAFTVRCKNELFGDEDHPVCCRRRTAITLATLTCLPCKCYREHPQGPQLTRIAILMSCCVLRFIAFILGASCATTYTPRCDGYAVTSSLTLVPSVFTLIIEWLHFHVLWNYRPNVGVTLGRSRDRSHLRFIPDKLTNNERSRVYDVSLCKLQNECHSNSIHHILLYHSLRPNIVTPAVRLEDNQIIIAFHVTTRELAIEIAQNGFPVTAHRLLAPHIYFTRIVERFNTAEATDATAIICVRLSLGNVYHTENGTEFNFPVHENRLPKPQTLQYLPLGFIKMCYYCHQLENNPVAPPHRSIQCLDRFNTHSQVPMANRTYDHGRLTIVLPSAPPAPHG